jgi:hypothetical protein
MSKVVTSVQDATQFPHSGSFCAVSFPFPGKHDLMNVNDFWLTVCHPFGKSTATTSSGLFSSIGRSLRPFLIEPVLLLTFVTRTSPQKVLRAKLPLVPRRFSSHTLHQSLQSSVDLQAQPMLNSFWLGSPWGRHLGPTPSLSPPPQLEPYRTKYSRIRFYRS